jgi:nitroreductase
MDIMSAIRERRSVKEFRRTKIPNEVLLDIFEAARWAPAAGNIFNTKVIACEDQGHKAIIAKATTQDFVKDAPIVLVVCSDAGIMRREFGERGDMYAKQSTAAAIQNILLAAEGHGVGTCWIGAFTEGKIRTALAIKDWAEIHAIIPMGYPARKPRAPQKMPVDTYVTWDMFAGLDYPRNPRQRIGNPAYYPERLVDKAQRLHAQLKEHIAAMKRKRT